MALKSDGKSRRMHGLPLARPMQIIFGSSPNSGEGLADFEEQQVVVVAVAVGAALSPRAKMWFSGRSRLRTERGQTALPLFLSGEHGDFGGRKGNQLDVKARFIAMRPLVQRIGRG